MGLGPSALHATAFLQQQLTACKQGAQRGLEACQAGCLSSSTTAVVQAAARRLARCLDWCLDAPLAAFQQQECHRAQVPALSRGMAGSTLSRLRQPLPAQAAAAGQTLPAQPVGTPWLLWAPPLLPQ